jgi:hypothetical protein
MRLERSCNRSRGSAPSTAASSSTNAGDDFVDEQRLLAYVGREPREQQACGRDDGYCGAC